MFQGQQLFIMEIQEENKMGMSFSDIVEFIKDIDLTGDFLEIGSERGDNSTHIFSLLAATMGRTLYSVDLDPDIVEKNLARFQNIALNLPIRFYNQSGEQFLTDNPDLKFSIVLLDNFDWQWNPEQNDNTIQNQIDHYRSAFSIEMNNVNSQRTHLQQAMQMLPMLTPQAIVICDDTWYHNQIGVYVGKCGAAIPFLLNHGFKIVHERNHGVILIRK